MKKAFLYSLLLVFIPVLHAQDVMLYKDPSASIEKRVEDLLGRMTLDEKIDMLGGTGIATKINTRLGIPELRLTDGPAGVRFDSAKSTAFPVPIAMAATWDPDLLFSAGIGIGRETKGHGRHVILGPCVNIARMTLGGRNFESFGEDPFLASRMTVPYIKGVQKEGIAATVKHFAVNNEEIERMYVNAVVSRRALHEIYLPAFKAAVLEADVFCVMNAYNKINGQFAAENDHLLREVLRNEYKFNGLIMSDWWAVHSSVPTALGEMDIEMPFGDFLNIKTLKEHVESGVIPVDRIDKKVRHILSLIFKLGIFDRPADKEVKSLFNSPENRKVAYDIALASAVLLKNEKNILPLSKDKIKTIAVIGQNAQSGGTGGGGSSEVASIDPVSFLQGLKNKLNSDVVINYAKGAEADNEAQLKVIESKYLFTDKTGKKNGLNAEYYNNLNLTGMPVISRTDKVIDFDWVETLPGEGIKKEHYSVKWTGYIKVPKTGTYSISTLSDDGCRLWIEDKLIQDLWYPHGPMIRTNNYELKKNTYYKIQFDLFEKGGGAVAKLAWNAGRDDSWKTSVEPLWKEAAAAAKKSDYVVLFAGTTPPYETEGRDRPDLFLPDGQDRLIEEVAAVNKNVIVVINAGSPVVMDRWLNKVKAVVVVWFPGSEGGNAVADILLGNYNPSGKLPVTFPRKWEDCSAYPTYNKLKERTYYDDDIYVGYRHFDKYGIEPLFPFGFGLSYTTFEYSNINAVQAGDEYEISFDLKNTGKVKGEETAQLYVQSLDLSIDKPVKELKGFSKVKLNPGETKKVSIKINKDAFKYYSERFSEWKINPGKYIMNIGSSSRDIKLKADIIIE